MHSLILSFIFDVRKLLLEKNFMPGVDFCFCSDTNLRCFISFTDIRKKAHGLKLVIPVKASPETYPF